MSLTPFKLRQTAAFFDQPPSAAMTPPPKGSLTKFLRETADEIERLRAARDELRQTLWCVVHGVGVGGKVMLFRRDLEDFPGRDRAWLEVTKDEMASNLTLRAFEQSSPSSTNREVGMTAEEQRAYKRGQAKVRKAREAAKGSKKRARKAPKPRR